MIYNFKHSNALSFQHSTMQPRPPTERELAFCEKHTEPNADQFYLVADDDVESRDGLKKWSHCFLRLFEGEFLPLALAKLLGCDHRDVSKIYKQMIYIFIYIYHIFICIYMIIHTIEQGRHTRKFVLKTRADKVAISRTNQIRS